MGRAAFGVRILHMSGDDSVIGIARQPFEEEEEETKVADEALNAEADAVTEVTNDENNDDGLEIY